VVLGALALNHLDGAHALNSLDGANALMRGDNLGQVRHSSISQIISIILKLYRYLCDHPM